jgi:hypothetical protein
MKLRDEIKSIDGKVFDPRSGELLRQEEIETVEPSQAPKAAEPVDAMGIINQLSWAFNTGLFELTDPIVEGIGNILGIEDPVRIGQLVEIFNKGETAPKNMPERYARKIGEFGGVTLPITGLLNYFAKSGALGRLEKVQDYYTGNITKDTLKGAAKDTLDYIRKNPREALFIDLAFTGALAGVDQSIEEFMEEGKAKQVARATAPFIFFPAAIGTLALGEALIKLSPTRAAGKLFSGAKDTEGNATKSTSDILKEDPRLAELVAQNVINIPLAKQIVDMANNRSLGTAAKELDNIFKILKDDTFDEGKAFQFAKQLEQFEKDNPELFEGLNFKLDIAQLADSPMLNKMINEYRSKAPAGVTKSAIQRQNELLENFATIFTRATPQEKKEAVGFLRAVYTLNKKNVDELNERAGNIGKAEKDKLENKYRFIALDDIGSFFERAILQKLDQVDKNFQLKAEQGQFTRTRDGVDAPTRDPSKFSEEELRGEILPGIPSIDFTKFLLKFKEQFKPTQRDERDFQDVSLTRIYNLVDNFFESRQKEFVRRMEEGFKTNTNKDGDSLGVPGFREFALSKKTYGTKDGFPQDVEIPIFTAISRRAKNKKGKVVLLPGESIAPELQTQIKGIDTLEQNLNSVFNYAFNKFYREQNFKAINNPRDITTGKRVQEKDRNILYYPTQDQIDGLVKNFIKKNQYSEKDLSPTIKLSLPDAFTLLGKIRNSLANTQADVNKEFKDFNTGRRFLLSQQKMFDSVNKEILRGFNKEGKDVGQFVKEYQDTFSFFKNVLAKKALDPSTSEESLAKFLLNDSANLKALNSLFLKDNGKHVSSYITNLEKAVISKITNNNPEKTFMKDGEFDLQSFSNALKNISPTIRKNLPEELKTRLNNADGMATKIIARKKELEDKANAITEGSFMLGIKNYVNEGQNYGDVILKALKEPQFMNVLKKEADRIEAEAISKAKRGVTPDGISKKFAASQEARDKLINPLRALVWKFYDEQFGYGKTGFDFPSKMLEFVTHPKIRSSLEQIYSKKELENIEKLAELERRILSTGRIQADLSRGATTINQKFQDLFGFGIQTLESSTRAAFVTNKQSPINMFVGLGARLLGRQQMNVYDAAMYTAATNPKLAEKIINSLDDIKTPSGMNQAKEVLKDVGVYYKNVFDDMTGFAPRAIMATKIAAPIEGSELEKSLQIREEREVPRISAPVKPQVSQTLPSMTAVTKPSPQSSQIRPEFARTYEALFPDDYITTLLKQRQQ